MRHKVEINGKVYEVEIWECHQEGCGFETAIADEAWRHAGQHNADALNAMLMEFLYELSQHRH